MRSISFAWNAFWDNLWPAAPLVTRQRRTEAVAVDEFETELRTLTVSAEERADIRAAALDMVKLGVKRSDLEPMVRQWYTQPHRTIYELIQIKKYVQGRIDAAQNREGTAS